MKFNFRKVASVIATAVMIGSTVGLAAAANFPSPFVQSGAGNVAVVYSSNAAYASVDMAAVLEITSKLQSSITTGSTSSSGASASGGDFIKLDRSSSKLHAGMGVQDVFSRSVTSDDLPTLLADGVYTDYDSGDHDYVQKVDVANMTLTQFTDNDYKDDTPTIGIKIASSSIIMNYTLDFTDDPNFDNTLENTNLVLMGKNYFIVDQSGNTTTPKLTMLDSATSYTLNEGETKTVEASGKSYDITVGDVTSDNKVRISSAGKTSSPLAVGATYKVAEGVYVGVKDVIYKSKESATSKAEIAVGSGKLILTDNTDVELNENTVTGLTAHVINSSSGAKLDKVRLDWFADDDVFVTKDSSTTMPGFGALKLSFGGLVVPSEETIEVTKDGKDNFQLKAPIKDGDLSLDILMVNETTGRLQQTGKDWDKILRTNATTSLIFDADTDEYLVASWSDGKDSESYVLYATSFTLDNSANQTTIKNKLDSTYSKDVKAGDHITLGNVDLTVGTIERNLKTISLTGGSGVSFNTLYTKAGMKIYLPWVNATGVGLGAINGTVNGLLTGSSSFGLILSEADKNDNLGKGANITLTLGVTANDNDTTVSAVTLTSGSSQQETTTNDLYQSTTYSDLASLVYHDQGPTQQTVKIVYHGGESYGEVVLSAPSVVIGGGSTGSLSIKDSEVATLGAGKNLIVVGGACVNSYAAQLLNVSYPTCEAAFTAATGVASGEYLIQSISIAGGKIATLVAGYNAADTVNAAKALTTQTVSTDAGSKYKGTTDRKSVV